MIRMGWDGMGWVNRETLEKLMCKCAFHNGFEWMDETFSMYYTLLWMKIPNLIVLGVP
jgi:hypothetical protein